MLSSLALTGLVITDAITRLGRNGTVLFVSPAAEPMFATKVQDLMGDGLFERVHVADRPAYLTALSQAAAGGEDGSVEFRVRRGSAEQPTFIWIEMRCRPLERTASGINRRADREVLAVMRDVTGRKLQEQALEEARTEAERANAQKSAFLATMSHELRTPLNAIIGFSEMLMQEQVLRIGPERRQEYAHLINGSGHHLLSVVNGILDMSKIETGNLELRPERFALEQVIADCCEILALKACTSGIELAVQREPNLPDIVADKRSLNQIILNLLSNAIKFSHAGGKVAIGAEADGDTIALTVEDTGVGIGDEDLAAGRRSVLPGALQLRPASRRHWARPFHRQGAGRAAWRPDRYPQPAGRGHARHCPPAARLSRPRCLDVADGRRPDRGRASRRPRDRHSQPRTGEETCVVLATRSATKLAKLGWSRRDAVAVAICGCATVAILVNVLLMQAGPHPAPMFKGAQAATKPATAVASTASPATPTVPRPRPVEAAPVTPVTAAPLIPVRTVPIHAPATPPAPVTPPAAVRTPGAIITDIQRELVRRGFFDGGVDGFYGPKTDRAIRDFEQAAGLKPSQQPTEALLQAIQHAPARIAKGATAAPPPRAAGAGPQRRGGRPARAVATGDRAAAGAGRIRLRADQADWHHRSRDAGGDRTVRARTQTAGHRPGHRPRGARACGRDRPLGGLISPSFAIRRFARHGAPCSLIPHTHSRARETGPACA